ncbi:hypothetical protein [Allocoleopsis sp.]|uniref:hypothetical protein n=1 Tax=Allocoleopsis sp. TaxID=3088169 RepID=UPI002FCEA78A
MIQIPEYTAVTGRIEDWLKNPESRLPVSCTVLEVQDSMEGRDGIEDSWLFTSKALRYAAGVALELSNLRPKGSSNGRGLVASGPVSFCQMYSKLNEVLRRGGVYKNGAITTYLDYLHPDAAEFLNATRNELPWIKRALYVDENFMSSPLLPLIKAKVEDGTVWLAKKRWDKNGNRLLSQVCLEILLRSRGTCLLSHVQLGQTPIEAIPQAFKNGMKFLCTIHRRTGVGESGIYLSPEEDRQVGLGVLGLANLLAIEGVTYLELVEAMEKCLEPRYWAYATNKAEQIALNLLEGFYLAADVARLYGMERAFTVAPTASCSYRYRDREGYTTAPEISPPNCNPITKEVDRDSGTFGVIPYQYHPNTETAASVEWDTQYRLLKVWQRYMESTGLAHSISANIWDKQPITDEWLKDWLESPLVTTYYRLVTQQASVDKSTVWNQCDDEVCSACAE